MSERNGHGPINFEKVAPIGEADEPELGTDEPTKSEFVEYCRQRAAYHEGCANTWDRVAEMFGVESDGNDIES